MKFLDANIQFAKGINTFMHRERWEKEELGMTRVIVETCPEILEVAMPIFTSDYDTTQNFLPIHCASNISSGPVNTTVHFVPLLAQIGLEHGVGGEEGRGGSCC